MGTNLIITKPNGQRVPMESMATATSITDAKQTCVLNGEDTIRITVVSSIPQSYGIGDTISVFGRDYRLNQLPKVSKTGAHIYQYDMVFEGVQYDLLRVMYDVNISTTNNQLQDCQGDSLTGDLRRFMNVLIANANRVFPGKWALGTCPDTEGDKTLTFGESDNCLSVLQNLCTEGQFGVEFEIERVNGVYTIHLREKIGQTLPIQFEYGKGKGLYSITRDNVSSSNIVTRLKVYGSSENITSKYRADRLCMFGKDKASSYIEKPEAVAKYGVFEARKNFEDIKPTFTGEVSSIIDGDILSFIDTSFPFDLKAKNEKGETLYLVAGVSAKIHFNTGNLAGYEFEVHAYDHTSHKFTLVKETDERGNVFPSPTSPAFQIKVGDKYKVLDIAYPREIEETAERKLAEEGNKYYDQNSQPKVQYSVQVSKEFVERNLAFSEGVTNVFVPGDYLPIKDDEIGVNKSIRIKSFTRNVLDPYDYALTISDTQTKGDIVTNVISDLVEIDKVLTINDLKDPAQARANWRSSREVLNMVFDPETGGYYKGKITPESVDTMALSVGAKSMQFGLVNAVFEPNYNGNPQLLKWKGGLLTHYTINPDAPRSWKIADGAVTLYNDVAAYYIYAVCNRTAGTGTISVTREQHTADGNAQSYYFLVGILNSVDADTKVRTISLMYGFTTVNGRYVKTGRIESADGKTYFDLDQGQIGGRIVFSRNGKETTLDELAAESYSTKDYIANTLPGDINKIGAKIDGKVTCYYQTRDPSLNWAIPADERESHVGDMWYHPEQKVLRYYSKTVIESISRYDYAWAVVDDQKAIDAHDAAAKAQDTADGKRRVFVSNPYPPYDIGDLWVDGKELRRCATSRVASDVYHESDWIVSVAYDNTQTTIDGGLVTSGTLQVAGDRRSILAGVTGQGVTADSVRMWAGAAYEQRQIAPFRVTQAGKMIASNADIKGHIVATSGEFKGTVYATDGEFKGNINIANGAIRLNKDGSGSLCNGKITWPADSSIVTMHTLQVRNLWGYTQLVANVSDTNPVPANAAYALNYTPTDDVVLLPQNPLVGFPITVINCSPAYRKKKLRSNGKLINDALTRGDTITYSYVVTLVYTGEWFVVSRYDRP